jgi:hypothetical protein
MPEPDHADDFAVPRDGDAMAIDGEKYGFIAQNIDLSPDVHGVYALYYNEDLIYYGRASGEDVTIRSRLQSHLNGREGPCTQKATHYKREQSSHALARELELLQEFEKTFRKLPRCNERRA